MEMARDRDEVVAASHKEKVPELRTGNGQHCKEMAHEAEQGMGPEGQTQGDKVMRPWRWVRLEVGHMGTPP